MAMEWLMMTGDVKLSVPVHYCGLGKSKGSAKNNKCGSVDPDFKSEI